jgi:ankyrin repeat protein
MFPNPQDALPLPPRPNLDQYKKRAKDLLKASESTDRAAIRTWAASWIDLLVRLSDLTLTPQLPVRIDHWTDQLETFAREKLSESSTLTAAQFVLAQAQGFESWPKLARHIEAVARANSPVSNFELAAAAIVAGDVATLERLLHDNPGLIRVHSSRRHRAALLHYVSANGVEGYRQKTPSNIVHIADLLLRAGADVNSVADVYGGSTTLALVSTSVHPERAGVQEALMQVLLDHGATIDSANSPASPLINVCLANGRARAAEFLVTRGAHLDLEGAAGLGRLDVVKSYVGESGALRPNAITTQIERGLLWACEYGRNEVVEFLLHEGASLEAQANTGHSALHWAVIGGHADTIKLLLARGASLEARNVYGGTALGQALWSATNGDAAINYAPILALLEHHGAKL